MWARNGNDGGWLSNILPRWLPAPVLMFVCACVQISEVSPGVVLTLKINEWSLRKKKRPIFYCNNTGAPYLFSVYVLGVCVCAFCKKGENIKESILTKEFHPRLLSPSRNGFFDFECTRLINLILNVLQFSLQLHADFKAKKKKKKSQPKLLRSSSTNHVFKPTVKIKETHHHRFFFFSLMNVVDCNPYH